MKFNIFALLILLSGLVSFGSTPVVKWELLPSVTGQKACVQRIRVSGIDSISRLCFTQLPRPMHALSATDSLVEINAGYYYVTSPDFGTDKKETYIDVVCDWPLRTIVDAPEDFHYISADGKIRMADWSRMDMADAALESKAWSEWMIAPDSIFRLNDKLIEGRVPGPFDVIPSFKKVTVMDDAEFTDALPVATRLLTHSNPEFYRITLKPDGALVEGASPKAVTMAMNTLRRRILEPNGGRVPCGIIEDWPDFKYRGLMIDVARNFQNMETMKAMVRLMADYRLNVLHFHITDDEGWRLEIPGLPELTRVGSRRAYTLDSSEFLPAIFTTDGNPDSNEGTANGFYTRAEFMDFLKYCDSLGVAVIPEIESPGHARAAIKAMEARYRNTGDDAYRLISPEDTSAYTTAQFYHDNLMNPALPSTYRFIRKVLAEIKAMYADAGVELPGIHIGGDEVPEGAWDDSGIAMEMAGRKGVNGRHGLQGEFVKGVASIMKELDVPMYGWQDICTDYPEEFHQEIAPLTGGIDCWVSSLEPDKNIAVKGIKAGYPVILSNVDYFYMDMLYSPHPDERGLFWGGFVDEIRALQGYADKLCPPQLNARGSVIGVCAKLFSETVRGRHDMERLIFPKVLGLAERGWNSSPTYSDEDFSMNIACKELPRLARYGVNSHLRQPGISLKDGKVHMNSPYPSATIHFTIDGSVPDSSSTIYKEPFAVTESVKTVKAILVQDNVHSVPTILKIGAAI